MTDASSTDSTQTLLDRVHQGDRVALTRLLERDLEWITIAVKSRLYGVVGAATEITDVVHDVVAKLLTADIAFRVSTRETFRSFLARVVTHTLVDLSRYHERRRSDTDEARPDRRGRMVLDLDRGRAVISDDTSPSAAAARNQDAEWTRLALWLLKPAERDLVEWRIVEDRPFGEIGARLDITENAATLRFQRAFAKFTGIVVQLRCGGLRHVLDDLDREDAEARNGPSGDGEDADERAGRNGPV